MSELNEKQLAEVTEGPESCSTELLKVLGDLNHRYFANKQN